MKTTRSSTTHFRAFVFATLASALLGSAAHSQISAHDGTYVVSVTRTPASGIFPTNFYPPRTGGFFAENDTVFPPDTTMPAGAVLRGFAVKFSRGARPSGSSAQTVSSPGQCSGEISLDGGASFAGWTGACTGMLRLTPSSTVPGTFDTEMLALEITSTSLPSGVMLRESPTRQSTGRCSPTLLADGRYRIDSFLDIFTELSVDSGNSWKPQVAAPGHCILSPAISEMFAPTDFFPPQRVTATGTFTAIGTFSDMSTSDITAGNVTVRLRVWQLMQGQNGARALPPVGPGVTATRSGEMEGEISVDGGVTFHPFRAPATNEIHIERQAAGGPTTSTFDTSILALACTIPTGGTGGGGAGGGGAGGSVMLRESPTKQSLGQHSVRQTADGNFRITSFLDVFFEVSIDGGVTWTAAASGIRVRDTWEWEDASIFPTNFFPPRTGVFTGGPDAPTVLFANGRHIGNVRFECGDMNVPLIVGMAHVDLDVDGQFFITTQAPGSTVVEEISSAAVLRVAVGDVDGDGVFESEIKGLDFVTGSSGVPSAVMLRESPTRASTGKTATLTVSGTPGGACRINSVFEVFTELSIDGGATWSECDAPVPLALASSPPSLAVSSDFLPHSALISRNILKTFFETGDIPTANQFGDVIDSFVSPGGGSTNPVAIRRLQIGAPDFALIRIPPPALGSSVTFDQDTRVEVEYTLNGGATWATLSCDATVTRQLTATGFFSAGPIRSETLSISLNGLPPGQPFRIRESPTRASLGRLIATITGGSRDRTASSSDFFLEASLDDGATWLPVARPIHCDTQAAAAEPIVAVTASFPTPGDLGEAPGGLGVQTASGSKAKAWLCSNFRLVSGGGALPPVGGTVEATQDGTVSFLWKGSGDPSFSQVSAAVSLRWACTVKIDQTEIECLSLSISGGTLPVGVMIRESPTRASRGPRQSTSLDGSRFAVSSFVDVFTEISVDSGATWKPCDLPIRLDLLPPVQKVTHTAATFPPYASLSQHYTATGTYADGSSIQAIGTFFDGVLDPLPDGLAVFHSKKGYDYYQTVRLNAKPAGSVSIPLSSSARFVLDATRSSDDGAVMVFDTEMLALDFGDATSGVMLRESPTKRSLGRTTIEPQANGTFRIGSFVDVFTEISFDGGATWSPSDGPLRLESTQVPLPIITTPPAVLLTVLPGKPAAFRVECEPSLSALHFEWLKAGVPIVGAPDSRDLIIPAATLSAGGFYACRVSNAGGSVVSASGELRVINPFPPLAGKYNGLVSVGAPGTPSNGNSGFVAVTVGKTGAFSGTLCWGGLKYTLKGTLDVDGRATLTPPIIGTRPPPSVTILLDAAGLHTTVTDAASSSTGLAFRHTYSATLNPTPHAGTYTLLLPPPASPALPQGTGFCIAKVKPDGSVTISGKTGDLTAFSAGAFLTPDGKLPVYAIVSYPVKGGMTGTLRMRADEDEDCDGIMDWYKPAQIGVYYPGGFATSTSLGGARYTVPPLGTPVVPLRAGPGNCRITLATDNPAAPLVKMLTISPTNIVTVDSPGADKLKVVISAAKGTITGSFVDPGTGVSHAFGGLVQQKKQTGAGTVKEMTSTGSFDTQMFR